MYPAINIGPLVLPTAALIYVLGVWLLLSIGERSARLLDLDEEDFAALVTTGLIAGFVGARLTFVALYWSAYQENVLGIIWPLNSGFSAAGGLFFGGAAMFFYGRYKKMPAAATLDALAPLFVGGLMIVSLADFLGGPGFGTPTRMPWGLSNFGIRRHPVQLYELLVGALALLAWWFLHTGRVFEGQLFLVTTAVYCFGRLFVDAYRADAWVSAGGWHITQILCLLATLAALFLLMRRMSQAASAPA